MWKRRHDILQNAFNRINDLEVEYTHAELKEQLRIACRTPPQPSDPVASSSSKTAAAESGPTKQNAKPAKPSKPSKPASNAATSRPPASFSPDKIQQDLELAIKRPQTNDEGSSLSDLTEEEEDQLSEKDQARPPVKMVRRSSLAQSRLFWLIIRARARGSRSPSAIRLAAVDPLQSTLLPAAPRKTLRTRRLLTGMTTVKPRWMRSTVPFLVKTLLQRRKAFTAVPRAR